MISTAAVGDLGPGKKSARVDGEGGAPTNPRGNVLGSNATEKDVAGKEIPTRLSCHLRIPKISHERVRPQMTGMSFFNDVKDLDRGVVL